MIISLSVIAIAFLYLLIETHFLTIHLLVGKTPERKEAIHLKEIDRVDNSFACPQCGNNEVDSLEILDIYHIKCLKCGHEYYIGDDDNGTPPEPIPPIDSKPLLLEQNCSLTKLHNEFKDSRYKPHFKDYRDSFQFMIFDNHTVTLNAKMPELYDTLKEVKTALYGKVRQTSIKTIQPPLFIENARVGSHNEYIKWNEETSSLDILLKYKVGYHHRIVDDYHKFYKDCLCGIDWLKAHENDVMPEPTIDLLVDGKEFHVNGNYKPKLITEFMGEFTHKERAGKKVVPVMNGEHLVNCGGNVYISELVVSN